MKRIVAIAVCVFLAAGALAAQAKKLEIAVCLPGSVEFFAVQRKGMDQAAAKYNLTLTYADAEWDAGKQLNQVENFVAKKVAAIMLCARDPQALLPAVKMCKNAGIPLITFTNTLGPDPKGAYPGEALVLVDPFPGKWGTSSYPRGRGRPVQAGIRWKPPQGPRFGLPPESLSVAGPSRPGRCLSPNTPKAMKDA